MQTLFPSGSVQPVFPLALIPTLRPQVVLINAVRDVAKALTELIGATKCAAGKAADDPSMYQLKSAAKVKAKKYDWSHPVRAR